MKEVRKASLPVTLALAFQGEVRVVPVLLPAGVVSYVRVTHRRQITGGFFALRSPLVAAVNDDLGG